MQRLCLIFTALLVTGLLGTTGADAAQHKKAKATPPAADVQPADRSMARPSWAAPQQCLTNDGYGRFLPCALGDGR